VPLEAIGLFGFAWTSLGPPQVHWLVQIHRCLQTAAAVHVQDRANGLLCLFSRRKLCHLHVNYRLHGGVVRDLLGIGHRWHGFAQDFVAGVAAMYASVCIIYLSQTIFNTDEASLSM
jgi:hypothetical protein